MEKVLSSHVGVKINEWYKMIRQFSVPDAEILKAEVEQEIERMEEDQDLLIYYQLMCFRHQLMLDYIKPSDQRSLSIADLVDKIENSNHKLSGMLQYYNAFFRGMYEFSIKEYVQAIQYYKMAEKQLTLVIDDIEQAEFHFKVAEAYYIMKQTHVSMHHILKALEIYDQYDLYKVRKIQCLFVIAGNYDDLARHDKSIPHLKNAIKIAEEIGDQKILTKAFLNIGHTFDRDGQWDEAINYFEKAIQKADDDSELLTKLYFAISCTQFKAGRFKEGEASLKQGTNILEDAPNKLYENLFTFLEAVYVNNINEEQLAEVFQYLEQKQLFAYAEACYIVYADEYGKQGQFEEATAAYQKVLETQLKIQRGDCLYEF
ncbi:tetratricopeptide repeat protein [Bacillus xiamenensis]|uniref:response regulator aspartate phosphatase n=1 Tax=Bacillus xiamenensis TaxID=1178537 RepID=UPI00028E690E|nr:tetratricopeptide repeat protein [Bacillus xiamenensis]EKF34118.1 aspartate phosphatase response regulator H [Bacillus xiamenensis]